MLWSISGGAGFLGLHLARRLLADGHDVRTLDVVPLDDAELERSVDELRGDIRDRDSVGKLVQGADVVVHAAAALPIQASRGSIRSVNVGGTENVLRAADDAGVRRVVFISSTAVYGVPEKHPIEEDDPLVGVGSYGESKIDAEGLCRVAAVETTIVRPKTFIGPERLGVFEILFDWIREGRRIYTLGKGHNRYQLLASRGSRRCGRASRRGAGGCPRDVQHRCDRVRHRAFRPAGTDRPCGLVVAAAARSREAGGDRAARAGADCVSRRSPSGTTRPRTRIRSSTSTKAQRLLGWQPRLSNRDALIETYDWYLANRGRVGGAGVTHRVPWNQQALGLLKRLS